MAAHSFCAHLAYGFARYQKAEDTRHPAPKEWSPAVNPREANRGFHDGCSERQAALGRPNRQDLLKRRNGAGSPSLQSKDGMHGVGQRHYFPTRASRSPPFAKVRRMGYLQILEVQEPRSQKRDLGHPEPAPGTRHHGIQYSKCSQIPIHSTGRFFCTRADLFAGTQ